MNVKQLIAALHEAAERRTSRASDLLGLGLFRA
jgi:hypothetical protein